LPEYLMKPCPPLDRARDTRPLHCRAFGDRGQLAWLLQREIAALPAGAPGPALLWLGSLDESLGATLLEAVAARLAAGLRTTDTLFRLGQTGLGAVLHGGAAAPRLAERLGCSLRRPYLVQGQALCLPLTVVVARHGHDGDDGWDLVEALHRLPSGLT
jgi:hypothetical protein